MVLNDAYVHRFEFEKTRAETPQQLYDVKVKLEELEKERDVSLLPNITKSSNNNRFTLNGQIKKLTENKQN